MRTNVRNMVVAISDSSLLKHLIGALAIILIALALIAAPAAAQATSGVTGVVTDPSGATMPSVKVALANPKTGFHAETKTDDQGVYQFLVVPPGTGYQLSFTAENFRNLTLSNVSLGVGLSETRNVQMQVGATVQQVEITAQGEATINTEDASIGNVISQTQVQQLPIQARLNASAVLMLEPGVQSDSAAASDQYGSVTGARADQQNITVDGLDVTDETIGQPFDTVGRAPIDSVQEVRTIIGGADSTFGRSSSAQVDISTKSGTNEYHGSLREYNRNTDFEANNFFNNLTGVPRGALIRNQFGGNVGGPLKHDKLFFFFNYDGLRQTAPAQTVQDVPVDAVRNGGINYINSNAGCTGASRLNTTPTCITTLTAAQVKAMDPAGIGADPELVNLFASRYPEPNFPSGGDGINSEGYLFDAPDKLNENTMIGRLDYTLSSSQKLFARGTWDRDNGDYSTQQFPGDPEALIGYIAHNRSFVVGHTWQISPTLVNYVFAGLTRQVQFYPADYAPTAPNNFLFGYYANLASPYGNFSNQGRSVGVPEVREQLTWAKGHHNFEFGGDIRLIREYSQLGNSINNVTIGLGPNFANLSGSLRPSDINADHGAQNEWDGTFTSILGSISAANVNYNYDLSGNPLPIGSPAIRNWANNEAEFYAQDTWHLTSGFTLSYGLRWVYHGVPYEQNGYESIGNLTEQQLFDARVAAAASGTNGNTAAPLMSYVLAGPANNAPGYYNPDYKDFAPRLGIAYSPSFTNGFLNKLFGDRKTSIRAGGGIVYDRVLDTLEFELDEENFLFSNQVPDTFGSSPDPTGSLMNDPRFTSLTSAPSAPGVPISRPYTPNVDANGNPIGLAELGGFPNFFNFDRNMKTPYAVTASFGIQRELPGNFFVEADYFGRFGRRLAAIGDAAQQLNFKDPASGQYLNSAFGAVQTQLQGGTSPYAVTAQPWFENQMSAAAAQQWGPGTTCDNVLAYYGGPSDPSINCTQVAAAFDYSYIPVGDLSSTDEVLSEVGLLNPNTGLLAQTGSAGYIGNFASSNYNSLIVTLRKKLSNNLQFDFDYAYAHSIDNVSEINNNFVEFTYDAAGLVCDLRNLRTCRASSDFDARHTISANYVYTLPVGHGQRFLSGLPKALDEAIGGWGTSGIITWRSGFPLNTSTGTFPIDFTMSAPAVYVGPASNVAQKITVDPQTQQVQFFANQANALSAFQYPFGGGTGNRNPLRGPNLSNVDMGLFKYFPMPWSDNQKLQFRADAFNVFNNVSFGNPGTAINNPGTFGLITTQENSPRVLQVALQYEF
ncbi:MAG TPA: TonB-dependent receptor [Candidatus Acidoferrum sp.]|nr:TonB-dependent receptor [Candidatus Acidoferrum sp.]